MMWNQIPPERVVLSFSNMQEFRAPIGQGYKVIDIIKDIDTIHAMEEYGEEDEDNDCSGTYMRGGGRSYRGSYDGYSYRRGRDSMGRYTSRDYGGGREHSRDRMMERMQSAMDEAGSERERQEIMHAMDRMGY